MESWPHVRTCREHAKKYGSLLGRGLVKESSNKLPQATS
jgi:hypothetical protein